MKEIAIYIKALGLAVDQDGNKAYGGIRISLGPAKPESTLTYADLIKNTSPEQALSALGFTSLGEKLEDMQFITPDEYEAEFGSDEDDE